MKPRIVVVGATGAFGERLSRLLARWPNIDLVLAARGAEALDRLAAELRPSASARIETALLDREHPDSLAALSPFAVVDCAGPFQDFDYRLARAALHSGAHYVDLADGRAFVAGFAEALDAAAREASRLAITGASSTPALSHAVLDEITAGWSRIERILVGISPGARAPRGLSVVRAILSWTGRPVRVFVGGGWTARPGWGLLRRQSFPGMGRRWLSLADTPDLDLLAERFRPRREALFMGGMELSVMHLGLWLIGQGVRARLLPSAAVLARPLKAAADLIDGFGSDVGGMVVEAEGLDQAGRPILARWSLRVPDGLGPYTPTLAAAASLRAILDGRLSGGGAWPCVGRLTPTEILREAEGLRFETRTDRSWFADPSLFRRLLGPSFEKLPEPLRLAHAGLTPVALEGAGLVKGGRGLAGVVRRVLGLPRPGRAEAHVLITAERGGETWNRRLNGSAFRSQLRSIANDPGRFDEIIGPFAFRLEIRPAPGGFRFYFIGWRIGPFDLPTWLGPKIRSRTYADGGGYRYNVVMAHPWVGVIAAYAGRLNARPPGGV